MNSGPGNRPLSFAKSVVDLSVDVAYLNTTPGSPAKGNEEIRWQMQIVKCSAFSG